MPLAQTLSAEGYAWMLGGLYTFCTSWELFKGEQHGCVKGCGIGWVDAGHTC